MHIHYLQHVPYETPETITRWAEEQNHEITGTHFYRTERLPEVNSIDALVIMGGPMGVHDEDDFSWLVREKEFIGECIRQNKKVLGICLGSQLIANVLGAEVEPMEHKEIGWFPITWSPRARNQELLSFLPEQQQVLHWHGDRFEIPDEALPLAESEACANQGFLIDDHILGLQFHLEMTSDGLADLIANSREELASVDNPWIQQPDQMLQEEYFSKTHKTMRNLLDWFFAVC